MKSVLVLFVILPLCYSLNQIVISEMISELRTLKQELGHFRNDQGQKESRTVYVPSKNMSTKPHKCKDFFFSKLKDVLEELLVQGQGKSSIQKLLAKLNSTTHHPVHDQMCRMEPIKLTEVPIQNYISFLRKFMKPF